MHKYQIILILSQVQTKAIEREYNTQTFTYMPSIFKDRNFLFDEKSDISICEKSEFTDRLIKETITKQDSLLVGKRKDKKENKKR